MLDAAVPAPAGVDDDLHHALEIDITLVAVGVPDARLDADTLGQRHHLGDADIGVVTLDFRAWIAAARTGDAEVAEVGQRAGAGVADAADRLDQPLSIARQAAVVLDDHVDAVRIGELAQLPHAVGDQLHLLLRCSGAVAVDANGVAAERLRGLHPLEMVFHRGLPR